MEKLNKARFLQSAGFLEATFNFNRLRFESSWYRWLKCNLVFLLNLTQLLRMFISPRFPRESPIQIWIGSVFNAFEGPARILMSRISIIAILWLIALRIVFNRLNEKRLYVKWMQLCGEILVDQDDRMACLSPVERDQFWHHENHFNQRVSKAMHGSLLLFSIPYNALHFVVRFEVDLYTYLLLQAINIAHLTFVLFTFLPSIHLLCLFLLNSIRFFTKCFTQLREKVARLNAPASKRINNRKLASLLYAHNRAYYDLIEMNRLFSGFIGVCFICFFCFGVLTAYVAINESIDWKIKAYLYSITLALYTTIILIPFKFASSLTNEINRTRSEFERIAFRESVSVKNKLKIELISIMSEKAGYFCFSWFRLNSMVALEVTNEGIVCLFLLFQGLYYMNLFS